MQKSTAMKVHIQVRPRTRPAALHQMPNRRTRRCLFRSDKDARRFVCIQCSDRVAAAIEVIKSLVRRIRGWTRDSRIADRSICCGPLTPFRWISAATWQGYEGGAPIILFCLTPSTSRVCPVNPPDAVVELSKPCTSVLR